MQASPLRTRRLLPLCLSLALFAPAAFASNQDIDKVNGSITVDASDRVGDLDTVNGSINIGAHARTGDAETVNGSIRVASNVQCGGLSTVNGSIRVEDNVQMNAGLATVNGSIFVDRKGNVRGDVETVNGGIGLVDTDVSGGIETVNGDVTVGVGSHVRGGIHYEKPSRQWISFSKRRDPRVVIGANARVDGPLLFERKVELYVHDSAQIGPVTGATAVRYSGQPPQR
ncbi:hypothetical protein ACFQZQ_13690 [Lysobacter koreensis]|uniref:Polymer-forming cytoskeletal protein n=1 Tax=Lysobacter koreensis TaxID=266122 RepID=A0ABW2YQD2_9GAMM